MISAKIPYSFLKEFGAVTWREIEFGLVHRYIASDAAVEYAHDQLNAHSNPDPDKVTIAALAKGDPFQDVVHGLAQRERAVEDVVIANKWLCVLISWLYENRREFADPLGILEELYADFDYPKRIAGLIRYMPADEPSLGSREANERRLIARWGEFVGRCRAELRQAAFESEKGRRLWSTLDS
jgi:hypothetical protein